MISADYINELVKRYAASSEGRKAIKEKTGINYSPNLDEQSLSKYGARMRQILFEAINPIIKSITLDDVVVGKTKTDKEGNTTIEISFREGSLHRESLAPGRFPEGLRNIVLLFSKGYRAQGSVHGVWHKPGGDVETWSRRSREPNDFLKRAVDIFNAEAKGIATAKLVGEYSDNETQ